MPESNRPDRPTRKNGRPPAPGMRFGRGVFGWVLFILLAIMLFVLVQGKNRQSHTIPIGDFWTLLVADQVQTVTIEGDELVGDFKADQQVPNVGKVKSFRSQIPTGNSNDWRFTRDILDHKGTAAVNVENSQNLILQVLIPLIPWLLIFGFI